MGVKMDWLLGKLRESDTTTSGGSPITGTLTPNELVYGTGANTIASLPVATYPSLTEISYVKGVTSAIQTQLNAKGNVSKVGTPVNNQIGVWTGDGTIEGAAGLTYSGTLLTSTATTEQLRAAYDASNYFSTTVASNGNTTLALTGTSPTFQFNNAVNIGIATATTAQLTVLGGQAGQPIISLVRTSGASVQFDWSLAGGGLSFSTNGRVVTNIFGDSTENEFYVGQKLTILAGQNTRNSIIGGTTIGSGYGSNTSVANLIIQGNLGNGNGTSGDILLKTGNTGSSGTTTHTSSTKVTIKNNTGNVGIGTTSPTAKLHVLDIGEQLRLGYDASNYFSTIVGSTGGVTFDAVGAGAEFVFSDDVSVVDARMSYDTTAKSLVFNIPA